MRSHRVSMEAAFPGVKETLTTFEDGSFRLDYQQDAEPLFDYVKYQRETTKSLHGPYAKRFLGSVPVTELHNWLMESGLQYGSKEWLEYCRKKLQQREYRFFQGHRA